MTEQIVSLRVPFIPDLPHGEIVAVDVVAADYLERYAGQFHEWVRGYVIRMSPISRTHNKIGRFLSTLLDAYLSLNPIGVYETAPFVMRVEATQSYREPDLQIILGTNTDRLTETVMDGPADICIEIVSDESVERDYSEKLKEYEKGGVREYWLIDPSRQQALFYRLNETNRFIAAPLDPAGQYTTPLLPGLTLSVPVLWRDELPDVYEVGGMVRRMQP